MAESLTGPKKHIALDTDWQSALAMAAVFFISAFVGIGTAWITLRGTFRVSSSPWLTLALLAFGVYCCVVIPERSFRIAVVIFAVGPVVRIALWTAHASAETLLVNEIFVRWIHSGLYLAGCVYAVVWFRRKITHV
jgi:hypothetical protein